MFKIVDLVKRRDGLTVAEFQDDWRDRHGALLAAVPGVHRYVQSHALPQGYLKGELLFDGIAEMWFDDEASSATVLASPEFSAVERDAERILDRGRHVRMPVDVHVIKDGAIPAGAVKNIEFVNRLRSMPLEPFRAYWREVHGPLASKIPVLRRYEQNHLKASCYANGQNPPYDGLAVTWFASTSDMKLGTGTPEYEATRADEPNFLPPGHLPIIITREHVLKS